MSTIIHHPPIRPHDQSNMTRHTPSLTSKKDLSRSASSKPQLSRPGSTRNPPRNPISNRHSSVYKPIRTPTAPKKDVHQPTPQRPNLNISISICEPVQKPGNRNGPPNKRFRAVGQRRRAVSAGDARRKAEKAGQGEEKKTFQETFESFVPFGDYYLDRESVNEGSPERPHKPRSNLRDLGVEDGKEASVGAQGQDVGRVSGLGLELMRKDGSRLRDRKDCDCGKRVVRKEMKPPPDFLRTKGKLLVKLTPAGSQEDTQTQVSPTKQRAMLRAFSAPVPVVQKAEQNHARLRVGSVQIPPGETIKFKQERSNPRSSKRRNSIFEDDAEDVFGHVSFGLPMLWGDSALSSPEGS